MAINGFQNGSKVIENISPKFENQTKYQIWRQFENVEIYKIYKIKITSYGSHRNIGKLKMVTVIFAEFCL